MKPRHLAPFFVFLLSLLLLTCGQKQDNPRLNAAAESDLKEVRATIAQISLKMEQAVLANDYETQLSFLADDIIIDGPLEAPVRGKAAVQERNAKARQEGVKFRSFSGTTDDLWVSGDRVYERGTWGMSFTTNKIKQPFAPYGSFFEIWTKDSTGEYRIQYLIYTLDMNPYETGKELPGGWQIRRGS
jgi:ketosteroid isomerase-like protein